MQGTHETAHETLIPSEIFIWGAEKAEDGRREFQVNFSPIVLYAVRAVLANSIQVGTVLFTTTDLVRKCWTDYDKSLLKARAIMQDVLPDPDCLDFSNPEAIVILLDYFHACYQIISTSTYGKVQNLMFVALSDAFGGYLRAHVLPFTRKSYYAGKVKYSEAQKLFQLYDDIKSFLKTDGRGWATPPNAEIQAFKVKPLVITGGTAEACGELYIIEKERRRHYLHPVGEKSSLTDDDLSREQEGSEGHYLKGDSWIMPTCPPKPVQPLPKSAILANPWNSSAAMKWGVESANDSQSVETHENNGTTFDAVAAIPTFLPVPSTGTETTETVVNTEPVENTESVVATESVVTTESVATTESVMATESLVDTESVETTESEATTESETTTESVVTKAASLPKIPLMSTSRPYITASVPTITNANITVTVVPDTTTTEAPKNKSKWFGKKTEKQHVVKVKTVIVPLPVLDDQDTPNSIAVPFKKHPFRNLKTASSVNILEYYYISVIKCFLAKGNTRTDIKDFNGQFYSWLVSKVLPHLGEEQWYPGFGGVLRIIETIKLFGTDNTFKGADTHDYGFLFEEGAEFHVDSSFRSKGDGRDVFDVAEGSVGLKRYLITAILITCLLMFFVFCGCIIYWWSPRGQRVLQDKKHQGPYYEVHLVHDDKSGPDASQKKKHPHHHLYDTSDHTDESDHVAQTHPIGRIDQVDPASRDFAKPPGDSVEERNAKNASYCSEHCARALGQSTTGAHGDIKGYRQHETHFCTHYTKFPSAPRRPHNVHTLWKKPSNQYNSYWTSGGEMEKDSKGRDTIGSLTGSDVLKKTSSNCSATVEDETKYSTEVQTMTCNCTGSCHCTTLSDSTTITKAKKTKPSTITIFDGYYRNANSSSRSSTQYTTTDSDSEVLGSSEYSTSPTSVTRKHRNSKNYP